MLLRYLAPIQEKHFRVDLSAITPQQCMEQSKKQIENISLPTSMGKMPLAELFAVSSNDNHHLTLSQSNAQLDYVASKMNGGSMVVEGSTGDFTAQDLAGGNLVIHGDVGHYCGNAMRGGELHIYGNAGNAAGGAVAGAMHGQSGGSLIIHGDAGDYLGDRLRRGFLIVCGSAGNHPASRMIAGNIVVYGDIGNKPALGMRRGSVLLSEKHLAHSPAYFTPPLTQEITFLILLLRHLNALNDTPPLPILAKVPRSVGDLSVGGIGEIFWIKTHP